MTLAIRLGLGLLALIVVTVGLMWIIGLGPFNTRPSSAAKELPKVEAKVEKTQAKAAEAVAQAETKTAASGAALEQRTETNVAKVRAAAPRVVSADVPDGAFFDSVCQSQFYAGSADCRGRGGKAEGGRSRPRP